MSASSTSGAARLRPSAVTFTRHATYQREQLLGSKRLVQDGVPASFAADVERLQNVLYENDPGRARFRPALYPCAHFIPGPARQLRCCKDHVHLASSKLGNGSIPASDRYDVATFVLEDQRHHLPGRDAGPATSTVRPANELARGEGVSAWRTLSSQLTCPPSWVHSEFSKLRFTVRNVPMDLQARSGERCQLPPSLH